MTGEEREALIQDIIERLFKVLPSVIGNLMTTQALNSKLIADFYGANKDLEQHKDIVREVMFKIEGQNPLASYEEVIQKAIPIIREQVKVKSKLSMVAPQVPPPTNGAL